MTTTNHTGYRIEAFDHEGEQLSLSPDPHAPEHLTPVNLWEAAHLLATLPTSGWHHWDDGESSTAHIATVHLDYLSEQRTHNGRTLALRCRLETITRTTP